MAFEITVARYCIRQALLSNGSMNPVEKAIQAFGGATKLASVVGITRQAVRHWRKHGWIPARHIRPIIEHAQANNIPLTVQDLI